MKEVTKVRGTYLDLDVGHEHGEVGEVGAGACGVRAVGGQQAAVLRGPHPRHGALRVAPEGAVGVEVLLRMLGSRKGGGGEEEQGAEKKRGGRERGREREREGERERERETVASATTTTTTTTTAISISQFSAQ